MNKKEKKPKQTPLPKVLSQEELLKWWPFQRVCGKSLEKLHKQSILKGVGDAPV